MAGVRGGFAVGHQHNNFLHITIDSTVLRFRGKTGLEICGNLLFSSITASGRPKNAIADSIILSLQS